MPAQNTTNPNTPRLDTPRLSNPQRITRSQIIGPSWRRQPRTASAFTLIELLVVIAIIAILIGMLFAAFRYVRNSGARSSTKVALDNLSNMLGDYDASTHFVRAPVMWNWGSAGAGAPVPPPASTPGVWAVGYGSFGVNGDVADFWRHPYSLSNSTVNPTVWDSLDTPGDVNDSGGQAVVQRSGSNAILNTQIALQMLCSLPSNRAAFTRLPAGQQMYLPFVGGQNVLTVGGPAGAGVLAGDGTDGVVMFSYSTGTHVTSGGNFYVSLKYTNAPVTDTSSWRDEQLDSSNTRTLPVQGVPLIKDGWNNPIIFVPASGLHVRMLNGQSSYLKSTDSLVATQDFIIVSPEGQVINQGTANPKCVKPGRPFFASAGPDGDFNKGDDNIYSFEH